jgi:hypothetical protein
VAEVRCLLAIRGDGGCHGCLLRIIRSVNILGLGCGVGKAFT